jgi:hypothetical protein
VAVSCEPAAGRATMALALGAGAASAGVRRAADSVAGTAGAADDAGTGGRRTVRCRALRLAALPARLAIGTSIVGEGRL